MKPTPESVMETRLKPVLSNFESILSSKNVYDFMQTVYAVSEDVVSQHHEDVKESDIACKAGCGTCCRLNVSILPFEAIAILQHIDQKWDTERKEDFHKRLRDFYFRCQGLEDEDRIVAGISCVFLSDKGTCTIYPVRPLICRSVTSRNADDCKASFSATVFGEETLILMNLFQKLSMEHAFNLLSDLLEKAGYDGRSAGLLVSLKYFSASEDRIDTFFNRDKMNYV